MHIMKAPITDSGTAVRNTMNLNELPDIEQEKETRPKVSIVVPIYNEESLLPSAASDLYEGLQEAGMAFEIILCENGSTDRTLEIANSLADEFDYIRVLPSERPDYGGAIRAGMLATRAPYIFVFDIDYFSVPFLREALASLKEYDAVIASKLAPGAEDNRSLLRRVITQGFNLFLKALFNIKVKETHGMKAFRRKKIMPVIRCTRMAKDLFDTELIIRAERSGLTIKEVPIAIEEKRPTRSSLLKRIPRTVVGLLILRYLLWMEHLVRG
ncbi:MAG: glycosyltransferase [Actinobacteria bacterium]|nr:glycosyltransferase [Actinomycetota bacterium]